MMDLIFEYLIVFILLFVSNIAFLVRKSDFNKIKVILFTLAYGMIVFILSFGCSNLNIQDTVIEFLHYLLFFISLLILACSIHFVNYGKTYNISNDKPVLVGIILISLVSIGLLSLCITTDNSIIPLTLSILSIIMMFLVYNISKIFDNAKRPYYAVIGEYMFLEFILLLIFALTFTNVRELDYSMFGSFLILTPTYQVMYILILIAIILVFGVLNNERVLKKLKRK